MQIYWESKHKKNLVNFSFVFYWQQVTLNKFTQQVTLIPRIQPYNHTQYALKFFLIQV